MAKDKLHQEEALLRDHLEAIQERIGVLKARLRARDKMAAFIARNSVLTQADVRAVATEMTKGQRGRPSGTNSHLAVAIRAGRKKAGLKATQLAKRLGVNPASVSGWERGSWVPKKPAVRAKLKQLIGVDVSKLASNGHAAHS
jgi:DNA-binding transcriptional regulator YiaG